MTSAPSSPRLALALGALLALACRRSTPPPGGPDDPGGSPAIFVDPGTPDPKVPGPAPASGREGGDPAAAEPVKIELRPIPPEAETPDFKATLEGMASDPPSREREGLAGVATCEGGTRQVGESWRVKCNTCTCEASGEVTCTLMACVGE